MERPPLQSCGNLILASLHIMMKQKGWTSSFYNDLAMLNSTCFWESCCLRYSLVFELLQQVMILLGHIHFELLLQLPGSIKRDLKFDPWYCHSLNNTRASHLKEPVNMWRQAATPTYASLTVRRYVIKWNLMVFLMIYKRKGLQSHIWSTNLWNSNRGLNFTIDNFLC